jgi:hypothetical protein
MVHFNQNEIPWERGFDVVIPQNTFFGIIFRADKILEHELFRTLLQAASGRVPMSAFARFVRGREEKFYLLACKQGRENLRAKFFLLLTI